MNKFIKFAFVAAIAAVAGYNVYQSQSVMNGMSEFALANVEALAHDDEIDEPVVPYRRLDSMTQHVILNGQILTTQIPCCKSDPSKYSGCAKGLASCE